MDDNTYDTGGDDWLAPPADTVADTDGPERPNRAERQRKWMAGAGLVAAGAVAGAVIFTAVGATGSSVPTSQIAPTSSVPGGQANGQPGVLPAFPGGGDDDRDSAFDDQPGRLDGEQRLQGTLTAVGESTITVTSSAGTATYAVTAQTEIVRNGRAVALAQLRTGDPVLVHVYPSGSGGDLLVERVFAGDLPAFGAPPAGSNGRTT